MTSRLLMSAAFVLIEVVCSAAPNGGKMTPTWSCDKKLHSQLAPHVPLQGFMLRPPEGYTLQRRAYQTSQSLAWLGRARLDGSRPHLMVIVVPSPPSPAGKPPLDAVLHRFLAAVKQRRQNWTRTPPERGTVNGIAFVRAYWSGLELTKQRQMHGFSYVTIAGPNLVHISSQDVEPYHRTSLKLAEAAALTFRKR